jgi:pimeloyl-ACP methyl ester carboxylesterase
MRSDAQTQSPREPTIRLSPVNTIIAVVAGLAILTALFQLHSQYVGVEMSQLDIGGAPTTIYRPSSGVSAPVVVIAHGFAGSGRLMQSFALTLARNGYVAATFDFPGHGRNARPLSGDLADVKGATQLLVDSVAEVAAAVRGQGDGRLAVLGHSMASDVVVRFAEEHPEVSATIAVSMFSPAVTATEPRDLLVIDGDWEGFLKDEGRRAVGLATAPNPAQPGVTYGDPAAGAGRRLAFSRHVEHASVLYSQDSEREIVQWLDDVFGIRRSEPIELDARGPWILALLAGSVALARPLARALPAVAPEPRGAGLAWKKLWAPAIIPMIVTPILLRFVPTHFLPVLVGDYLSVHFAAYGLITAATLWAMGRRSLFAGPERPWLLLVAALAVSAYSFVAVFAPINTYVTSFIPGPGRYAIVLALLCGALPYFLADEWLTRGEGSGRLAYPATTLAFLVSLGVAVTLDFERLFFLILIVPIVGLFFIIYGLFSAWTYGKVRHPFAAGIANAIAFAWAISVTFPLVAG